MSAILRILLVTGSILTALYIQRKMKKSQMHVNDAVFWILFSSILIFLSAFPVVPIWFSKKMGIISPVNFVFLVVMFLLVVRCFILSINISSLEKKIETLVQELSLKENVQFKK